MSGNKNISFAQIELLNLVDEKTVLEKNKSSYKEWLVARALIDKGLVDGECGIEEQPINIDYYSGYISYKNYYWFRLYSTKNLGDKTKGNKE